jgi:MFS family permease
MALDNTDSPEGNDGNDSSVLKKKTNESLRKDSSNVTKTTDDDDTNDSSLDEPLLLSDSQRLAVDKNVVSWALFSLRLGLIADSISMAILAPNYPFMVNVNQHPDSFPSIEPFGFNAATYFLPMTAMLGSAFSSVYVGSLSDRVGRRPCILVCVGASVFGNILKYLARNNFWAFCGLNFLNGLFGATLPVALAYVSDIHPNRDKKNDEIGKLIGFNMMGVTGGGVVAILMQQTGLFTPLFVGAAFNFLATVILYFFLLEPDKSFHFEEESTDDDKRGPPTLKKGLMAAIIGGAILDNIGSAGLWPLALSPLAFVQFYDNFVQKGLTPIMTETAYKWISMILAVMVIPGAALSGPIFSRFGAATACVFGNIVTAIGITAVLLIATMDPPTNASFGGFIVVLYLIMPFTVLSNLSTGPMLDMIAPVNKRGFVQGINSTTMNIARSASPFVLGAYADAVGVVITMWTCVGISVVAALANTPLTFVKQLKPRKRADHSRALEFEDEELVDHIKQGKWVPPKQLGRFQNELLNSRFSPANL